LFKSNFVSNDKFSKWLDIRTIYEKIDLGLHHDFMKSWK